MRPKDKYGRISLFVAFFLIFCFFTSSACAQSRFYYQDVSTLVSVFLYDSHSDTSPGSLPRITEVNQKENASPFLFSYLSWSFPAAYTGYDPIFTSAPRQAAIYTPEPYKGYQSNYQGYWDAPRYDYTLSLPRWGYSSSDTYEVYGSPYGRGYSLLFNFPHFTDFQYPLITPAKEEEPAALECTVVTDKAGYVKGEQAAITFTVTNTGGQPADLQFSSGRQYDILIKDEAGNQVWQQSRHQFYIMSLGNLVLQPGEVKTYQSQWDQTDDQGAPVSGGIYSVEAFLTPAGKDYQISATAKLAIVDMIIDESYHEQTVHVSQGSMVQVNLKANATTGYQWQGEWDTSLVALHDHSYLDSPGGLLGAGGTDVWLLKAYAPGETDLSFVYLRPWETGVDPAQELSVHAVIDAVNQPPDLSFIPEEGPYTVDAGQPFTLIVNGRDLDIPDCWHLSLEHSQLPDGATLTDTGIETGVQAVLDWQPDHDQAGEYPVTFTVSDGKSSTTRTVTITVNKADKPSDTPPAPLLAAPLKYALATDKALYSSGEEILITFTVTNYAGAEPIPLNFTSGQRFDAVVKDSFGKQIFRLSDNKFFTLSLAFLELKPGESMSFQDRWDQKDSQGSLIPPGTYTLEAFLTSTDYSGKDSTTITIGEPRLKNFANSGCKRTTPGDDALSLSEEVELSYSYQEDTGILFLKHTNASYNCCIEEISVTMSIKDQVINIFEEEKLDKGGCFCTCNYDVTAEVADLSPGTYKVNFFNKTTGELAGAIPQVVIPGGDGPRLNIYANSGCKRTSPGDDSRSLTEELQFSADYRPDTGILFLKHTNASYNCCIEEIAVTMSIKDQVINIYEEEKLEGGGCRCMCNYDVTAEAVDLPAGTYEVNFFNKASGKLAGTIPQVVIP